MPRPTALPPPAPRPPQPPPPPPAPPASLEAKVVVLGSQNVGKTSLVHRYVHSTFLPGHMTPSTVGASFVTTRVHDPETDTTMRLQIWDTAGQERFRSISKLYYRGAHAAVLCYDITSAKSFDDMAVWLRELKDKGTDEMPILHVVGTKADIVAADPSQRQVSFERCIEFVAAELFPTPAPGTRPGSAHRTSPPGEGLLSPRSNRSSVIWTHHDVVWDCCHEISAKDGEGIEEVFRVITRKLIEQHQTKMERQRMLDMATPGWGLASATPSFAGGGSYFDSRHGGGYLTPGGAPGSFRLGHGDKRRSWLGLPASMSTTPGQSGLSVAEEERLRELEGRSGRCCT